VRVPASRVENRQNQQRSRERHREYVASLEKRLSEYENHGAQATIEMQNAARAVAVKNERLLALLQLHGVQRDEIEAFVGTTDVTGDTSVPAGLTMDYDTSNDQKPQQMNTFTSPLSRHGAWPEPRMMTTYQYRDGPPVDIHVGANLSPDTKFLPSGSADKIRNPSSHRVLDVAGTNDPSPHESTREVTSCEDAASILASLRGHGDVYEARAALGCAPWSSCSVKNTRLFQLMNEVP
jgi:hypothetical protein